jgi:hypothetical protein
MFCVHGYGYGEAHARCGLNRLGVEIQAEDLMAHCVHLD